GLSGNSARTVSAWIKPDGDGCIISWGDETGTDTKWLIGVNNTNGEDGEIYLDTYAVTYASHTIAKLFASHPDEKEWHHVAVTYENEGLIFYVDGNFEGSYQLTSALGTEDNTDIGIGAYNNGGTWESFFHGLIDDVRIYNRALTEEEINILSRNLHHAAMVNQLDYNIGRILDKVDNLGIEDDTIIFFTSDNGGSEGLLSPYSQGNNEYGQYTQNSPLKGGKGSTHEGGVRVPLIVKWPGTTSGYQKSEVPVSFIDILPTIINMACADSYRSADYDHLDGVSLVPILKDQDLSDFRLNAPDDSTDDGVLHLHIYHNDPAENAEFHALRKGNLKMIGDNYYYNERTKKFEAFTYKLFNLKEDIGENEPLPESNPNFGALKTLLDIEYNNLKVRNLTKNRLYDSLADALNSASEDNIIEVPPRQFGRITIRVNGLTLKSKDSDDSKCVAATIIYGSRGPANKGSAITIRADNCKLQGLTIAGGYGSNGGGIDGGHNSVTIENCIIRDNQVSVDGGGIYNLNNTSVVSQCIVINNTAGGNGGGLADCYGTIKNCLIAQNIAQNGGGLDNCDGDIINCTIVGNKAWIDGDDEGAGGGLRNCNGVDKSFTNCIIRQNSAEAAGTSHFKGCNAPTNSCYAGGSESNIDDDPKFVNIFDKIDIVTATVDASNPNFVDDCSAIEVSNTGWYEIGDIIEYNNDGIARKVIAKSNSTITINPRLLYASKVGDVYHIYNWKYITNVIEDYHLRAISPCIDAGDNNAISDSKDFDGYVRFYDNPEVTDTGNGAAPIIDMGVYEWNDRENFKWDNPE
ncbi:LamG-like jellyroll fold domain-containing protein, partial [Planctomycetota bacterium]